MQSVHTVNVYVDQMLATLYYTTTLLPSDMDGDTGEWLDQMELVKRGNSSIVSMAFFHGDGSLFGSTAGEQCASPEQVRSMSWFQKALEWGGTVTYFSMPHV